MNKTTRRFGIALAAMAGLACAVPAAFAATTFTVTAGSATPGTVIPFHAITTGTTPQVHFNDVTSNVALFTCDSGAAAGTLTPGTGLSGTDLLAISGPNTTWTNCQGAGFNYTLVGSGNWTFDATSGSTTGASGALSGVNLSVTGTGSFGTTCNFTLTGSMGATYTNADTTLHVNGSGLTVGEPSGYCASLGIIENGDSATLSADYMITADSLADNPVAITQP